MSPKGVLISTFFLPFSSFLLVLISQPEGTRAAARATATAAKTRCSGVSVNQRIVRADMWVSSFMADHARLVDARAARRDPRDRHRQAPPDRRLPEQGP